MTHLYNRNRLNNFGEVIENQFDNLFLQTFELDVVNNGTELKVFNDDDQALVSFGDNGDLSVSGNLIVTGTIIGTTTVLTNNLNIEDNFIELAISNSTNLLNLGAMARYNDGVDNWTGWARDVNDGRVKIFDTTTQPTNTGAITSLADVQVNSLLSNSTITTTNGTITSGGTSGGNSVVFKALNSATSVSTFIGVDGVGLTNQTSGASANSVVLATNDLEFRAQVNTGVTADVKINSTSTVVANDLGVGTSTPTTKLEVNETGDTARVALFDHSVAATQTGGYVEVNNPTGTKAVLGADGVGFLGGPTSDVVVGNLSNGNLRLVSNGVLGLRIDNAGNHFIPGRVAIGTTTGELFSVVGNNTRNALIQNTVNTNASYVRIDKDSGSLQAAFGWDGNGLSSANDRVYVGSISNAPVGMYVNNSFVAQFTSNGLENSSTGNGNVIAGKVPYLSMLRATQVIPDTTTTTIDWDTTVATRGGFSESSGDITVPSTGLYSVETYLNSDQVGTELTIMIQLSATVFAMNSVITTSLPSVAAATTLNVTSTSLPIRITVNQVSGGNANVGGRVTITRVGDVV